MSVHPSAWMIYTEFVAHSRHSALGKFIDGTFTNPAGTRTYNVHVPRRYQGQPLPLLVMLHGCAQDPEDFAAGTCMNVLADKQPCFVVYPAQPKSANPMKCWNWFEAHDQQRDQGEPSIIAGITREVMSTYHIDEKRVFIAGLSAGGAMAITMAATYPDLYAAVGVSAGMPYRSAHNMFGAITAMRDGGATTQPLDGKAIPIIVFHGDQDSTVHPKNGEQIISQWITSMPRPLLSSQPPEVALAKGLAYARTNYFDAAGELAAEHWLVKGGGHAWFGGSPRGSYSDSKGPDTSEEMLRFFLHRATAAASDRGGRPHRRLIDRLLGSFKD